MVMVPVHSGSNMVLPKKRFRPESPQDRLLLKVLTGSYHPTDSNPGGRRHAAAGHKDSKTNQRSTWGQFSNPVMDALNIMIFWISRFRGKKTKNPKNYPKLASDSSGTLKIGFSVKFYIYI